MGLKISMSGRIAAIAATPVHRVAIMVCAFAFSADAQASSLSAVEDAMAARTGPQAGLLAQGGSTGGTIGKRDKSVSGGQDQQPAQPSKDKAPARQGDGKSKPAAKTLTGRWHVSQTCNRGKFEVVLDIRQISATEFAGTSRGVTTGAVSQISGGKIEGSRVSFERRAAGMTDRWSARIDGSGRMIGTSAGPLWQCSYTAVRR